VKVIHGIRSLPAPLSRAVLTIGNFDGVHLGHQELIRRVRSRADTDGLPSVVMTFEPHPVTVLYPDRQLRRIFNFEDQRRQLETMKVDYLVVEPFSREFSQLSPERYIQDWIYRPFTPVLVVVGYDFTFGANKSGSLSFLQNKAKDLQFAVDVVAPVKVGEHLVSSSLIRRSIVSGDIRLANQLLGREFYLEGVVERGAGRGRQLGVPTANLHGHWETLPAQGVYAAWTWVRGQRWPAAVNLGVNPTFENSTLSLEAHLIGFSGDLYGETLQIQFIDRLRNEIKFSSREALIEQIHRDVAAVKACLA